METRQQRYSIGRKLRPATLQDIENNENQLFYFMEGVNHYQRINRMRPEDYQNFKLLKDKKNIEEFKESCRADWRFKTKMLKDFLIANNLFIIKHQDNGSN